jgi:hypothetical protein
MFIKRDPGLDADADTTGSADVADVHDEGLSRSPQTRTAALDSGRIIDER